MSVSSIFGCGRGAKTRGSTCRIWVGMFAATLTTFVLVSLTVVLTGGFGAQPANAQTAATVSPWSWGWNAFGQLGDGTSADSYAAVQPSGLSDTTGISAGLLHSLAINSDNTVRSWGYNSYGQLGNGTNTDSNTPVQVSGLTDVQAIKGSYATVWRSRPTARSGPGAGTQMAS
jgi:hypothetical protein